MGVNAKGPARSVTRRAAAPVAGSLTTNGRSLGAADAQFEGEAANDGAGVSVSTVGDVDGDGFDDVLVGAYTNDTGDG